jgi:hypothetical protein
MNVHTGQIIIEIMMQAIRIGLKRYHTLIIPWPGYVLCVGKHL